MSVQEVLRLTWDKIDLERGVIEVSGEVKNEYDSSLMEQYVEHAPQTVSDTNYLPRLATLKTHSQEQQDALKRLREIFQRTVLDHLEREIAAVYARGSDVAAKSSHAANQVTA